MDTYPPIPPPAQPPVPRPTRFRAGTIVLITVVTTLLVVGAVGAVLVVADRRSDEAAQQQQEQKDAESAQAEASADQAAAEEEALLLEQERKDRAEEEAAANTAQHEATFDRCVRQIGQLQNSLQEIDARLDVGLNQDELSDLVGDASVAYGRLPIKALGVGRWLSAAAKLESAFNKYVESAQTWGDCLFEDLYCELDDIETGMQRKWGKASRLVSRADSLLDSLDPASPRFEPDALA